MGFSKCTDSILNWTELNWTLHVCVSLSHSACLLGSSQPVSVFSLCLYLSITFLTQFAWFHRACSYFWLYVSLFVTLSAWLPSCLYVCLSVGMFVWLSGSSSLCLSVGLFGCLALPDSVCLPGSKLPIHTSLCLCFSICLSVCLSVCLSFTLLATIFSLVRTFDFVLFHNRNPSWKTSTASSTRVRCLTYLTTRSWTASPWTWSQMPMLPTCPTPAPQSTSSSSSECASTCTWCWPWARPGTGSASGAAWTQPSSTAAPSTGMTSGPRRPCWAWPGSSSPTPSLLPTHSMTLRWVEGFIGLLLFCFVLCDCFWG